MNALTPWFPARLKPKRKGDYLARFDNGRHSADLLRFDGKRWWWDDIEIRQRSFFWRGLAFDPSRAVESQDAETGCPGMWVPTR